MGSIVQLANVSRRYGDNGPQVLRDVTLDIAAGQSLAVVGPSGCGKSTLLNIIGTLDQPTHGRVMIDGEDVTQLNGKQLAHLRNRKIGFVFQDHHLLPQLTAIENVLIPTLAEGSPDAAALQRGESLLVRVGLKDRMNHQPARLSGGERQRVAVVRALINEPMLLLADEPTGSLDRKAAAELGQLLVELNEQQHVALVVVTHAMSLADKMAGVYELIDGRLLPPEPPEVTS
jgi:ABC-type lipoprotein export system ATPase subunit